MRVWTANVAFLALMMAPAAMVLQQRAEFTAVALAVALQDKGTVSVHQILFDTGTATIKPESAPTLASIGELLQSDAMLKVEIQGHTDNVGTPAVNLRLSRDRAAAVKTYLVQNLGIAADRLTTSGFGDTKPVATNATQDGRAQNVRIELLKK